MLRLNPQVLSNASVVELFCKYAVFTWLLDVSCVSVVILTIGWLQGKQTEGKESICRGATPANACELLNDSGKMEN